MSEWEQLCGFCKLYDDYTECTCDVGYYGPFDGWPEPPAQSKYGVYLANMDNDGHD